MSLWKYMSRLVCFTSLLETEKENYNIHLNVLKGIPQKYQGSGYKYILAPSLYTSNVNLNVYLHYGPTPQVTSWYAYVIATLMHFSYTLTKPAIHMAGLLPLAPTISTFINKWLVDILPVEPSHCSNLIQQVFRPNII